jgi:hypothetical protein
MKKEIIIAIIIGFALGLLITFGIWTANKAIKNKPTTPAEETDLITPTEPTPAATEFSLTIISPEDDSLINTNKVELKGSTVANALIVIAEENGEKIIEADEEGSFATELVLIAGTNEIKITAFNSEGDEVSKTLSLVYSTKEI